LIDKPGESSFIEIEKMRSAAEMKPPSASPEGDWSISKAIQHYNIENWGVGYFFVNDKGHLCVQPYGRDGPSIDIMDVIEDIQEKKLGFPCVIRFQDVLRSRVVALNEAFHKSIQEHQYPGR